jgi:DASS family divalent anion:Na+ symporter
LALARRELQAMGPMSRHEWVAGFVFLGLLVLWVAGDAIGIGATLAAAIGVCLMIVTGVLTWNDALEEKSAWDTMIWIALLIMLAGKLNEYGMVAWFGSELGALLAGFGQYTVFVLISLIYFYVRYFFASATAHIAALFPVCLALMVAAGVSPFAGAIALGALSSVCGCLTQYAIGSSPVMFGAGYVSQREWWRAGFIGSLVYLPIWLVGGPLWWSALGRY